MQKWKCSKFVLPYRAVLPYRKNQNIMLFEISTQSICQSKNQKKPAGFIAVSAFHTWPGMKLRNHGNGGNHGKVSGLDDNGFHGSRGFRPFLAYASFHYM